MISKKYIVGSRSLNENSRIVALTKEIRKEIIKRYRGHRIPSVRSQLRDL